MLGGHSSITALQEQSLAEGGPSIRRLESTSEQALTAQLVSDVTAHVNKHYEVSPDPVRNKILTAQCVRPRMQSQQEKHFLQKMQWIQRALEVYFPLAVMEAALANSPALAWTGVIQ